MKIHFDNLFADFGHVSLNKKKESLCGDFYITEERGSDTVLVLSDGLDSGVKPTFWQRSQLKCSVP